MTYQRTANIDTSHNAKKKKDTRGKKTDMDERIIFLTKNSGTINNIHSFDQVNLRQCSTGACHSAVRVGNRHLLVAQAQKALINVYDIAHGSHRESIEQKLPLPEAVNCLEVVENQLPSVTGAADFRLPYLLLASTESGKLYVWELNSGLLLNVKNAAHYHGITKIKSIMNGRYVITSGNDARVIIWQTADLVSQDDPKPIVVLQDHTLPVTDFVVSNVYSENVLGGGLRLYTVSRDRTLRCYELGPLLLDSAKSGTGSKRSGLIATFTLPYEIMTVCLDPAERAVYVGTPAGCFSLLLFYRLQGNKKIANLLEPGASSEEGRIFSLIEAPQDLVETNQESTLNRDSLYNVGQLVVTKIVDVTVSCLQISMDGTLLLVGDSHGRVFVVEIFSKQILRTLQSLNTAQETPHEVTNILIDTFRAHDLDKLSASIPGSGGTGSKIHADFAQHRGETTKLPVLRRDIFDRTDLKQTHDIWYQLPVPEEELVYYDKTSESRPSFMVTPLNDFDKYLENVRVQGLQFSDLGGTSSAVKVVTDSGTPDSAALLAEKQKEIDGLKRTVSQLTDAYKELREIHEKLYQEHKKLVK